MLLKRFVVFSLIGIVCLLAQDALATLDIGPADTHQAWSFDTADNPTYADTSQNPHGDALASIEYDGVTAPWLENYLGHQGVWEVEDWMKIHIPNDDTAAPSPEKSIWIQMVFTAGPQSQNNESQLFTVPAYASLDILETEILDENFIMGTYLITLEPMSESEDIYILPRDFKIYIDSLTIDTRSVPEPATLALLGIGSLFTMIRKRK